MHRWRTVTDRLIVLVVILAAWQIGSLFVGAYWLSSPGAVAWRFTAQVLNGELIRQAGYTIEESLIGILVGGVPAVLLPFLLRRHPLLVAILDPFMVGGYGAPKLAFAPLFILWFGIGDLPKLVVVTLVVFYILFITTFAGIRGVDQRLIKMARIIGASEQVISREIIWTSLLPFFFTGLKIALPRAVSAAIVGEFLVAVEGVGFSIERARQLSDTTGVFAGIVVAVALVLIINVAVNALERRAMKWRPTDRDMQL